MMLGITSSWAQVSFTVDAPSPVNVGDRFRVEFTVDSEPDRDSFEGPNFEGFDVLAGPSTSVGHSIQIINGKQSSSYSCTYTYVLLANEEGRFNIGSASINVDGKRYTTKPLPIEVLEGGATPSGTTPESQITKDNIMLRWVLSDSEIYKGEAVRASLVLYYNVPLADCEYPEVGPFDNFWSQRLTVHSPRSRTTYNNRVYDTHKFYDYILIPHSDGSLELPEASATAVALVELQSSTRDIFYGGMEMYHIPRLIKTEPTVINVKDFPEGAPASFNGAVGDFTMTYDLPDEDENTVNSSNKISVTISGSGNFKFITAPKFSMPKAFELYDTQIEEDIQNSNNTMSGSVTYSYPYVARVAGEYELDAIEFSYFNPSTGEYNTLSTPPIELSIINDGSIPMGTTASGDSTPLTFDNKHQILNKTIRYIKEDKIDKREKGSSLLIFSSTYWLIMLILIALFIAIFFIMRQRIRANRNVIMRRMKHADKVAIQRLRVARDYMKRGERHAFYEELLRAMWGYISDKFNIPVSNLTKEAIREELTSRGMSYVDAELFCTIISRADEAQYAPSTDGDMSEVYNDAVDAISKIESVVKHRNTMRSATNIIVALIATSIALVSSTTATYANDNNAESLWADANSAYNNALYDDAIAKYQALLEMGYEDESVYYNLGNAYFKRGVTNTNNKGYGFNNGELGRAILNYERALKIDPEMEDAKYNLEIANELTQAPEAVPVNFLTSIWQSISSMVASNTWCIVSIVLFFMSLTLVLLYLLSANRRMRIISFFTAIATTILFMLTTGFAMTQRSVELDNSRAVVICNDTQNVYSEPKKGSTQIRTCGQGVVVTILDTRNGWTEVKFADGDKGWIPSDNVERI